MTTYVATERTIEVSFIDFVTGESFGKASLPSSELPENFDEGGALRIGDGLWVVVEASPPNKAEFELTGQLRLVLRLAQTESRPVRYGVPSLADGHPKWRPLNEDELPFYHIDIEEWRQIELIDAALLPTIESEISDIWDIHRRTWFEPGFPEVHLREALPKPLSDLSWSQVEPLVCGGRQFDGLFSRDPSGERVCIENGFAVETEEGLVVYGRREGERVTELCFADPRGETPFVNSEPNRLQLPPTDDENLRELMRGAGLAFVDWCACTLLMPDS